MAARLGSAERSGSAEAVPDARLGPEARRLQQGTARRFSAGLCNAAACSARRADSFCGVAVIRGFDGAAAYAAASGLQSALRAFSAALRWHSTLFVRYRSAAQRFYALGNCFVFASEVTL